MIDLGRRRNFPVPSWSRPIQLTEIPYHTLRDLLSTVATDNEVRRIRTIHKAKGDEFGAVLVHFEKPARVRHVLHSKADEQTESQRVTYVALSRARDQLLISTPTLSQAEEDELKDVTQVKVVRLKNVGQHLDMEVEDP